MLYFWNPISLTDTSKSKPGQRKYKVRTMERKTMSAVWQSVKNCWIILSVLFMFTDKRQKKWLNELNFVELNTEYKLPIFDIWLVNRCYKIEKNTFANGVLFSEGWNYCLFRQSSCFNPNVLYIEIIYFLPIQGPFRKSNFCIFFLILIKQYYGVLRGQKYSKWLCFVFKLLDSSITSFQFSASVTFLGL